LTTAKLLIFCELSKFSKLFYSYILLNSARWSPLAKLKLLILLLKRRRKRRRKYPYYRMSIKKEAEL